MKKEKINNFIRDITSVSFPLPKSEVRRRLNEILDDYIPKSEMREMIEKMKDKWADKYILGKDIGVLEDIEKLQSKLEK